MKLNKIDKSKIIFNDGITIENIPQEAWNYKLNGCSAVKWITARYQGRQTKTLKSQTIQMIIQRIQLIFLNCF